MAWELDLLHFMQSIHSPVSDTFFKLITKIGDKGIFCILLALAVFLLFKDKRMGACMMLALLTEAIICNVILKNAVARERPYSVDPTLVPIVALPKDYSFPSGHSSATFATAVAVFGFNRKWGIFALVIAALVAISRLYLTVHFPTDVLAGVIIGAVMGVISAKLVYLIDKKYPLENRFGVI